MILNAMFGAVERLCPRLGVTWGSRVGVVLSGVSEGQHRLIVYVNDTFGNLVSSGAVYFSVDTLPPRLVVFSPENRSYGESDIASVFTVDEPVSWMGYSLDGRDNV